MQRSASVYQALVMLWSDMPVPSNLVGQPCDLRVITQNQSSIHPGTDVEVTTGGVVSVISGVEDTADARVVDTHRVTLGTNILIEVTIGPDGSTSLGFTVSFECTPEQLLPAVAPAQQTTTTTAPVSTVTGPTVSAPLVADSTTTPVPVVGGVTTSSTVGGGTATSKTEVPAPVLPNVLGVKQTPPLPQAPAARATTGSPSFTG